MIAAVGLAACGGDDGGGTVIGGGGPYFPAGAFWDQDVSGVAPAANSDAIIGSLRGAGGWGNGDTFQIDFSIDVLRVDGASPAKRSFTPTGDFYEPDCDAVPMPVPPGGNVEGEAGYACTGDGDCHLLVWAPDEQQLYEMWRANIVGDQFDGGCLAVWDTSRNYGPTGRGEQCTSADAAGFPIAPLLFTADEIKADTLGKGVENPRLTVAKDAYEACAGAHAIAIVTEWDEFKTLDYAKIFAGMPKPAFLFDGRNIVDLAALRKIGFKASGIGKPAGGRRADDVE